MTNPSDHASAPSAPDLSGSGAAEFDAASIAAIARNRLADEASPYLRQHADNPVHWQPWGRPALAAARALHRPILLSVGYAACHWCHVMAHESFEDPVIAARMNESFVNVKVDREERPDIDQIYMSALHAMGEQGGWPLTIFLTPDGDPFWGGTYFPPAPRFGRPSFAQVLTGIARSWSDADPGVRRTADALRRALGDVSAAQPGDHPTEADFDAASQRLLGLVDFSQGGLKGAPKFPNAPIFRFLWQRAISGHAPRGIEATRLLLRRMADGGIHDHLGGGFARYATDAIWLVPHFEKMLYDNAQLLELLALSHAHSVDPTLTDAAIGIVDWLRRDMMVDGAFAAAEDADSEGVEGRFYVWSDAQIVAALGDAASAFAAAYDVTRDGNWEGHVILRRMTPRGPDAEEAALARSRETLRRLRERRPRPQRDDKVLADWNGLMVAALVRAATRFDRPDWLALARGAFAAIDSRMRAPDGRVMHAWCDGRVTAAGLLDDQACMARAALALFEATGETAYLDGAIATATASIASFADPDEPGRGSFFLSAAEATDVPGARPRSAADQATPSGNGVMAEVMARLYHLTGDDAWRERAGLIIRAFAGQTLAAMPTLAAAADLLAHATSVVVVGHGGDTTTMQLLRVARSSADPTVCVLALGDGGSSRLAPGHPAFGKQGPAGRPAAFVCRDLACGLPVTDPSELRQVLASAAADHPGAA